MTLAPQTFSAHPASTGSVPAQLLRTARLFASDPGLSTLGTSNQENVVALSSTPAQATLTTYPTPASRRPSPCTCIHLARHPKHAMP